ncbi:MAG: MmcQ/YjbR family DNA-binding protein [Solirubrobacteraceae bacterium]
MADFNDVRRLALSLPESSEVVSRGNSSWRVRDKGFVWERPLRKPDLRALGDGAPAGPILGARVEHLVAKEALIADNPDVYFTTPHFDGYPAVLVQLDHIALDELEELIVEAWLARAPVPLARDYVKTHFEDE